MIENKKVIIMDTTQEDIKYINELLAVKALILPDIPKEERSLRFPANILYRNAMIKLTEIVNVEFQDKEDKASRPYLWHLQSVQEKTIALWRSPNTPWMKEAFNQLKADFQHGQDALMAIEYILAAVSIAHDLLEDTPVTKDELKALKIPNIIIDNIVLLTKSSNRLSDDELTEYYRKIKENPIARCVKIADLIDNLDLSRNIFSGIKEKDIQRSRKYLTHLNFLLGE